MRQARQGFQTLPAVFKAAAKTLWSTGNLEGQDLCLGGDGCCDSPGYAKY